MKYCTACHKTYPTDHVECPADHTLLQVAHELQPGMIIRNKYQILNRIGIGGMGLVYRGRHLTFNELCAIKIVNDDIAGNANFLKRFQTEAMVTRKLRHPNAVRVDDFDYTEDGRPFIVMELVEGKNISEIIHKEGALAVPRAIRIARQVALAIGVAHKFGIVHRDLKPGNIILSTDEQGQEVAKVLDFGIAKLREAAGEDRPDMTMTGMVVGTPLYMSPEQFMGKKAAGEIDGRTDIYALGVVLYQMITGQVPFDAETPYALMLQHLQGTVKPPHEVKPELGIPEALSQVILKSMEKSRELRFQTAEEFVAALDQVEKVGSIHAIGVTETRGIVENLTADSVRVSTASAPVAEPRQSPTTGKTQPTSAATNVTAGKLISEPSLQVSAMSSGVTPLPPAAQSPTSTKVQPTSATPVQPTLPADSRVINSAAQHVFLPPPSLNSRLFVRLVVVGLAAVLVAGAGYLKYRSVRRVGIQEAVGEKLKTAASQLGRADIRVFVSDDREVTLDGKVRSSEDSTLAESLAASVPGVVQVKNRLEIVPIESSESLIKKGTDFLDAGNYPSAIDCFRKALANPEHKGAQELLDRAQRAQQTEEELLKGRQ
jgi:serine/threonine protein kinase